jgi:hypothetical protein
VAWVALFVQTAGQVSDIDPTPDRRF